MLEVVERTEMAILCPTPAGRKDVNLFPCKVGVVMWPEVAVTHVWDVVM